MKTGSMLKAGAVLSVLSGLVAGNMSATPVMADSQQHITLTFWQQWGGGHNQRELDAGIKQYEQLHPNITIKEVPVTDNTKILAAISGGNAPDIIDLGSSQVLGEWASKGMLMNLEPFIKKDKSFHLNQFVQSGLDSVTYNGQLYGLPFMNFDAALMYNKAMFKKAGIAHPPKTLEELTQDAYKLTKQSKNGQITQMGFVPDWPGGGNQIETYAWLFGGDWFNQKGQATPGNANNVKALTWEDQFFKKYGAQNVENFVKSAGPYLTKSDPFQSGKLAMSFDGVWVMSYIEENNPKLAKEIGVIPMPAPQGEGSHTGTTYIDTNPQVIPTGAKNAQAAWDFISWETTNAKIAGQFATVVANLPQLKNAPTYKLNSDPYFKVFIGEAKSNNAQAWKQTANGGDYFTQLGQLENTVLVGGASPVDSLKQLAQQLQN